MNADQIREFIQAFVQYIFQTFSFEKKEMRDWLPVLPSPIQQEFMSTYDILIQEGKLEGKLEGLEEGLERGTQAGLEKGEIKGALRNEIQMKLEFLVSLLTKLSVSDTNDLAEMTRMSILDIEAIKKLLKKEENKEFIAFVRDMFKNVPLLTEKDLEAFNQLALDLFKRYKEFNIKSKN